MFRIPVSTCLLTSLLLNGCASAPMGPTALVMSAPGKPFDVFAQDQTTCKQFAGGEVNGGATVSNLKQFGAAAVATALGAGLGAAVRNRRGAEIGGAMGAIAGASGAAYGSARDQNGLQGRYDLAYTQCMYSKGNQIAGMTRSAPRLAYGAPPVNSPPEYRGGPGYYPTQSRSPAGSYPQGPPDIR